MPLLLVFKAAAVWVLILALAFVNAALRELVFIPWLGHVPGLALSGALLALLVFGVAYACLPWLGTRRSAALAGIGAGWLALSVVFDLAFGVGQGKPLQVLLEAYTFKGGNLWPVVLLITSGAPYMAAKLRGWRQHTLVP